MADFVMKNNTKTAVRELAAPIADVTAFDAVIQAVLSANPFGCTAYEVAGISQDPVVKSRENYTARILYQNGEAKTIGQVTARAGSVAGFSANITELLGNTALSTAMGGDAVRDTGNERFLCTLQCHDPSGEVYYVSFSRDQLRISSYSDDAIVAVVEAWADTVPALA
jgi:hypothetical protein